MTTAVAGPRLLGDLAAFRRDRLAFVTAAARTRGDVAQLRLGPRTVVLLSHPQAVGDVLAGHQHAFRKGPILQQARMVLGEGLLTSEDPLHRRQRRLLQPAFSRARSAGYAEVMAREAVQMAAAWQPGEARDVHADATRLALDVAARVLLGVDTAHRAAEVARGLNEVLSAYELLFLPFAPAMLRLPLPQVRRLERGIARLHRVVEALIAERGARGPGNDLLGTLLHPDDGDAPAMDSTQLRDEVLTLLLAGHETTASTIAFCLHLLAEHPRELAHVQREAHVVAGEEGELDAAAVAHLPRTAAAVSEALRLYPPSWAIGRQAATDVAVTGVNLPAGATCLVSPWVVQRDPRWWPHPDRFDPGRWDSPAEHRPRFSYFPFGAGGRVCIGESFALTEAVFAVAAVCRRWDLRPAPGHPHTIRPSLTLRPAAGTWLVPTPRS